MRSSIALLALSASLASAHTRDFWQNNLPKCWQNCFSKTEDGCASSRCVCDTAGDSSTYLSSVVSCAVSQCNADRWATTLVLGPLELTCLGLGDPIDSAAIASAYAAASPPDTAQSTRRPAAAMSSSAPKPQSKSKGSGDQDLTTTLTSTLTQTTTDSGGNTLLVIIPIIVGPSGVFTGEASTSTVTVTSSSAPSPSAAGSSLPTPTQRPASTSSAGAQRTQSPASGNGSPFENMQAGASRWAVSGPMLGLGAAALLFMRL